VRVSLCDTLLERLAQGFEDVALHAGRASRHTKSSLAMEISLSSGT
jgi:hypothetical protein